MKKVTISVCDLFKGEAVGGLEFGDWLTLDEKGKLKQRLSFISSRANVLIENACSPDSGMPGNIAGDAHLLQQTAIRALQAAKDRDFITASTLALDTGRIMAEINALLPVYGQLKLTVTQREANSKGGKAPKRSGWAELLAEHLAGLFLSFPNSWAEIPEDEHTMLCLDEDTAVYRSNEGETVVAVDRVTGNEIGDMSESNFKKRYFSHAKKNRDSN